MVRRAVADDARDVASVHVRAWREAYRDLVPAEVLDRLSVDERERVWRGLLRDTSDSQFTLVAVGPDGRIEGFCSVTAPSRDEDAGEVTAEDAGEATAEVAATYVAPERWRRGVGGALLRAASAELVGGGWREVTLWVFAANDRARSFYSRFGFESDGATRRHETSGLQIIRMRAALG